MAGSLAQQLEAYDVDPRDFDELDEAMDVPDGNGDRWKFILAEDVGTGMDERMRMVDVASQCASGKLEAVATVRINTVRRETRDPIELVLYFVERLTYLQALSLNRASRLERT